MKTKQEPTFDFFGRSYLNFEKDFNEFSALKVPLTYLTDDIMMTMQATNDHFFILNKENSKTRRSIKFNFDVKDNVYYYAGYDIL